MVHRRRGSCCLVDGGAVMTYEQWWWEFIAEHEDWRYADSDALRKAAFEGGQESLRQQLILKEHQYDVMKASAEVLAEQCGKMRQQLADSQKREVMLRDALKKIKISEDCGCGFPCDCYSWATMSEIAKEALAATADLKGVILCHAEPVGWCGTSGVGELIVSKSKVWNFLTTPLYRAWEPLQ